LKTNESIIVEIDNRAKQDIKKLTEPIRSQILAVMRTLQENPRPNGAIKLTNNDNLYRIRVGKFRIIYQINDRKCLVLVIAVGHRREIYRTVS
jgi:mRNA interferase RelE/StbE